MQLNIFNDMSVVIRINQRRADEFFKVSQKLKEKLEGTK
jgi:hypothetical protein